jgi:ankyrin repeat protein
VQAPGPTLDSSAGKAVVQPTWNTPEWQNQTSFLLSPGYLPATPLPVGWYGPTTPLSSASFQTPPGILQSPEYLWNIGLMDEMVEGGNAAVITDDSGIFKVAKYERLIELVRRTEETGRTDYMETMSEVNSLVYNLITLDRSRSQVIIKEDSAPYPKCYVCMALEEIGTDDMDTKVESERLLLEAIAVSEGCFGEEDGAAFHFRVQLFLLYENWSCRSDSTSSLLLRIMFLASQKGKSRRWFDLLSELPVSSSPLEPIRCAWLQGLSGGSILGTSSHQMSTLSIQDDTIRYSPRNVWEMISAIIDRTGHVSRESLLEFEPLLDLILHQGPESADGSSYFWMATFISAAASLWGVIYNSKMRIGNGASGSLLPGSIAIKSSLEQLLQNPYRLEQSSITIANGEPHLETADSSSLDKHQSKFDDKGVLGSLEELRLVLAEFSLRELEKSDNSQAFSCVRAMIDAFTMYDVLKSAALLGNSVLLTHLGKHFGNAIFEYDNVSWTNLLNFDGGVADWDVDALLNLAVSTGYHHTVEAFLNVGADPDGVDGWEETPVELAAERGHDEIVRLLVKRGASTGYFHHGVLRCIIDSSDQQLHAKWLENISGSGTIFPLLCCLVLIGSSEKYDVLDIVSQGIRKQLKSGGNSTPTSGKSPLHSILCSIECWSLVEFLDVEDDSGRGLELVLNVLTRVHIEQQARGILKTALFRSTEARKEMLNPTKSPELPTLHTLVLRNAPNALGIFLELGPNLAAIDNHGNTALHLATIHNRIACAQHLLKFKIDVGAKNDCGETALEISVETGHIEISEEIRAISHYTLEAKWRGLS